MADLAKYMNYDFLREMLRFAGWRNPMTPVQEFLDTLPNLEDRLEYVEEPNKAFCRHMVNAAGRVVSVDDIHQFFCILARDVLMDSEIRTLLNRFYIDPVDIAAELFKDY